MSMTKVQSADWNIDVAYGSTPESALLSVIHQQPAFNTRVCEYISERPDFMGVKPNEFHLHDWDQYESRQRSVSGTKNEPIVVSTRTTYDLVPKDNEQRKQITIDNVWVEVGYNNPEEDGRAEVMFRFSLQMRESAWDGKDEPRPGDLYWRCERISTEPIH